MLDLYRLLPNLKNWLYWILTIYADSVFELNGLFSQSNPVCVKTYEGWLMSAMHNSIEWVA